MSSAMGIAEDDLAALPRYRESGRFTDLECLALDLAVAMTDTPAEVPESLRSALLEHLTPTQLMELVSIVAWENHRARMNRALGVRAAGFADGGWCPVPEAVFSQGA